MCIFIWINIKYSMLSTNVPFIIWTAINFFFTITSVVLLLKKNQFIFIKIWIVFLYFIIQNILLGFFGEDFYIVLILASEFPIFFSFFFLYITKSQLNHESKNKSSKTKLTISISFFVVFIYFYLFSEFFLNNNFTYFTPNNLFVQSQKSDFFLFYFIYYVISPQLIIYIGFFITSVTFILVFFTFKTQINSIIQISTHKNVEWIRTQDTVTQSNQKKSFIFFKI